MVLSKSFKKYQISCGKCGSYVLTYHKHGAGKGILRLYFDYIVHPDNLVNSLPSGGSLKEIDHLRCPSCAEVLGVPGSNKTGKPVFRMRQGYFHRKLKK